MEVQHSMTTFEPLAQENKEKSHIRLPYFKLPVSFHILMALRMMFYLSEYTYHSLLAIYMSELLLIPLNKAVSAYHAYKCIALNLVLVSAYIMDSLIGKFLGIALGTFIFAASMALVSLPPLITTGSHSLQHVFLIMGVVLSGIGMSLFTASFVPFATDQFQHSFFDYLSVEGFFSILIFQKAILDLIAVSVIMVLLGPIGNLSGYLNTSCYSFCFLVCSSLSLLGLVIFLFGSKKYTFVKFPSIGGAFLSPCVILYAIYKKFHKRGKKESHWLDYAKEKFSDRLVENLKITLKVLAKQLAIYWVCYDQRLSSWTLLAVRLDRRISSFELTPEMLILWHPLFVMILIPIHFFYTYPLMLKTAWFKSYTAQMVLGLLLLVVAFLFASIIAYFAERKFIVQGSKDRVTVNLINAHSTPILVSLQGSESFKVKQNEIIKKETALDKTREMKMQWSWPKGCRGNHKEETNITAPQNFNNLFFILQSDGAVQLKKLQQLIDQKYQETAFYAACGRKDCGANLKIITKLSSFINQPCAEKDGIPIILGPGTYSLQINNEEIIEKRLKYGSIYLIYFYKEDSIYKSKVFTVEEPKLISMWWTIPQYLALSVSYVVFTLASFSFQFTKTPAEFFSIIWAVSNFNIGLENLLAAGSTGLIVSQAHTMMIWMLAIFAISIIYILAVKFE